MYNNTPQRQPERKCVFMLALVPVSDVSLCLFSLFLSLSYSCIHSTSSYSALQPNTRLEVLTSAAKIRFSPPPLLQPALRYEPFRCRPTNSGIKIDFYSIYCCSPPLAYLIVSEWKVKVKEKGRERERESINFSSGFISSDTISSVARYWTLARAAKALDRELDQNEQALKQIII